MIQFSYYFYELNPLQRLGVLASANPRKGALLKCVWPDQKVGYADCHPWPELGDASIDEQIEGLKKGKISFLLEQTIWLARKDAVLRSTQQNALSGVAKIKNHFLVSDISTLTDRSFDEIKSYGFTTIKFKVGLNPELESKAISRVLKQYPFQVRLDFNGRGDLTSLTEFLSNFDPTLRSKIEFIEDPMPWNLEDWTKASKLAPLAVDNVYDQIDWQKLESPLPFKVIVLKPVRQDVDKAVGRCTTHGLKMCVTSALDHPVGVVHAAVVAAEVKKHLGEALLDCGYLSLKAYRANEFSMKINTSGPFLTKVEGTGIGFDSLLQSLPWVQVENT